MCEEIFENLKIIKTLGAGMFGTTYLAEYQNKQYALKIQHILPKNDIREIMSLITPTDLYAYFIKKIKI